MEFDPSITSVTVLMEHHFEDHRPIQRKQTKGLMWARNTTCIQH
ncbi:hypothetical protein O9929_20915 [Vibrio lentus]|nr:hypothetical protein [Vibrio lentus]